MTEKYFGCFSGPLCKQKSNATFLECIFYTGPTLSSAEIPHIQPYGMHPCWSSHVVWSVLRRYYPSPSLNTAQVTGCLLRSRGKPPWAQRILPTMQLHGFISFTQNHYRTCVHATPCRCHHRLRGVWSLSDTHVVQSSLRVFPNKD